MQVALWILRGEADTLEETVRGQEMTVGLERAYKYGRTKVRALVVVAGGRMRVQAKLPLFQHDRPARLKVIARDEQLVAARLCHKRLVVLHRRQMQQHLDVKRVLVHGGSLP